MRVKKEPEQGVLLDIFEDIGDTVRWRVTRSNKAPAGTEVRYTTGGGYYSLVLFGERWYVHRLLWVMRNGPIPEGMFVDHIDGDVRNNNPANLRLATHSQNLCNQALRRNSTSAVKGVTYHKASAKWRADVRFEGVDHYLGLFPDREQAERAVRQHRLKLHGEYANHGVPA